MDEHSTASPEALPRVHRHVLIVDDEAHIRRILARWLEAGGYACKAAAAAGPACEILQQGAFSLVLADIGLPGMSGMDLLSLVRRRFPHVAVVMATAVDDRRTAVRALELGAYGYIVKPFDKNEVMVKVANALEHRRLALESRDYERFLDARIWEQTEDTHKSFEAVALRLMAAQEARHDDNALHIRRVGLYAEAIGRQVGYSKEQAQMLRVAASLHDIGNISVPDSVLLKPGEFSPEDREAIKTHTSAGGRVFQGTSVPLFDLASDVALCHHEWWDASGYPRGLSGRHIPVEARIAEVADVYDALTHDRAHRSSLRDEEALTLMADESGTHFDPDTLAAFFRTLPEIRTIRRRIDDEPGAPWLRADPGPERGCNRDL